MKRSILIIVLIGIFFSMCKKQDHTETFYYSCMEYQEDDQFIFKTCCPSCMEVEINHKKDEITYTIIEPVSCDLIELTEPFKSNQEKTFEFTDSEFRVTTDKYQYIYSKY